VSPKVYMHRQFLPYKSRLKAIARTLRKEITLAEVLLWNELKRKQMLGYDFHRQKPIDTYVVDFFCPKLLLAIEIDGASHEGKQEKDSKRQKEIERYGISFLRFSDNEVKQNLSGVFECIREWIVANGGIKRRRGFSVGRV
jgi:very-short-patch-repair endonuclease